jgi:hypothetical protein
LGSAPSQGGCYSSPWSVTRTTYLCELSFLFGFSALTGRMLFEPLIGH